MQNKKRFKELMTRTAEVFQRDLTKTLLDAYWEILAHYSDSEVEVAFAKALRGCQFFPKPVELIGFITGGRDQWITVQEESP